MLLVSLVKWISLAVTFGLGAIALFFGTYRENPKSRKRTPTRAGWIMLILLLVSFGASIISLVAESGQKKLDDAKANAQLQTQQRQIAALRKVALAQWPFAGVAVRLEFGPEAFQTILKKYPEVKEHLDDELVFVDKVVQYTPQGQDTEPLVYDEAGPHDELYRQFKAFVLALCSTNFSIMLSNGSELAELTDTKWPSSRLRKNSLKRVTDKMS